MTAHGFRTSSEENIAIPPLALALLNKVSQTIGVNRICVAGGFLRGLYMQQRLGLSPEMHDIDIFADISAEDFLCVRDALQKELGIPIRYHLGHYENEENKRGLIEFTLPHDLTKECGGIKTVQLNFGLAHPWAEASNYVEQANLGINQISMDKQGRVFISDTFVSDMRNKTMTMNPHRDWSRHDWERSQRSMNRMIQERHEFSGWQAILANKPVKPITGSFWEAYRSSIPSKSEGRY